VHATCNTPQQLDRWDTCCRASRLLTLPHVGHLANRAWWSSHAIITVEHNQSGARLCDLVEHADAWHGEVFVQSYLHGLNRPEAKDPTLIGAHKLSPKLKSHKTG
jgi:hypothetical protein